MCSTSELENAIEAVLAFKTSNSDLTKPLEILRAGSREHFGIRERLAKPGVLDKLIQMTQSSLVDLENQCKILSCVGNAVIDNDTAREHIARSHGFDWIAWQINDEAVESDAKELNGIFIGVLNNICNDCPIALDACTRSSCFRQILFALDGAFHAKHVPLAAELYFRLGERGLEIAKEEKRSTNLLQASDLKHLLKMPHRYSGPDWQSPPAWLDAEDWYPLVAMVFLFTGHEDWLEMMIARGGLADLWQLLEENEAFVRHLKDDGASEDDVKLVAPLSASLLWVLSDAASNSYFHQRHPLNHSEPWDALFDSIQYLGTQDQTSLGSHKSFRSEIISVAACQILANVLWTGRPCEAHLQIVRLQQIHKPILAGILSSNSAYTLHSITGLLWMWILTSKSSDVSEAVGDDERIMPALEKLLGYEMPQVVTEGKNLLRALGKYSDRNKERFHDLSVQAAVAEYNETNAEGPQMSVQPAGAALT